MESIKRLIILLAKNPFTVWVKWLFNVAGLKYVNRGKKMQLGYLCDIKNVQFGTFNTIGQRTEISNSEIGDYVYISNDTKVSNARIGKFCSIGPRVIIGLGKHPTHFISTSPAFYSSQQQAGFTFSDKEYFEEYGEIIIGNDVWIGSNSIILDNVEIGNGVIIAAGSVVTKNVAPYSIVAGVPACIVRKRFSDQEILQLETIKWWEKEFSWLATNYQLFQNPAQFFKRFSDSTY